jgi:hypothetical protein
MADGLFPDLVEIRLPRDGFAQRPIGRSPRRRRPAPARTVLRRAVWQRHFISLGDQVGRLAMAVVRLERQLEAERKQSAANSEKLDNALRKLTQLGHDLQLRETPAVPLHHTHTRRRPLG